MGQENFIPTNLGPWRRIRFHFDEYNKVGVNVEFNKLLVPTPPKYGTEIVFNDLNNNGTYEADEDEKISQTDNVIIEGKITT